MSFFAKGMQLKINAVLPFFFFTVKQHLVPGFKYFRK